MKRLGLMILACFLASCKTAPTSTVSPLQAAGCDIETAVASAEATAIAGLLTCSNEGAIQTSLLTALGNANLCAAPGVAPVTQAQMSKAKAEAVKPQGVIGNIVCPIVIDTLVGYATQAIPASWGCSASSTATSLTAALTTACQAAVPL